ncbi:UNVERIFIED_ORG: hypothetical protein J2Y81_007774 [Paraburkholderia sediminicola]|nr:hypothetical protein [Paraburkholderia sediminicola]
MVKLSKTAAAMSVAPMMALPIALAVWPEAVSAALADTPIQLGAYHAEARDCVACHAVPRGGDTDLARTAAGVAP